MEFEADFTSDTKETLEKAGPGPGWYLTELAAETYDPQKGRLVLQFKVLAPIGIGLIHREFISNPAMSSTQEERERATRKVKTFGMRMGLTEAGVYGHKAKINFANAVGKRFVLNLEPGKDKSTGVRTEEAGVWCDWAPYPLDHQKIPAAVRQQLGLALLPGQSSTPAAPEGTQPPAGGGSQAGNGQQQPAQNPAGIDFSKML